MINQTFKPQAKSSGWIIFFLILSFIWTSAYPVLSSLVYDFSFNYGNVFDFSSLIFSNAIFYLISSAILSWVGVEVIFMVYRFILSFKIYSFVVPAHKLKDEMRSFFIYRNILLGLVLNVCFVFPYLHAFAGLLDVIITTITFLCFASHINKAYSEPIVRHFVFKCFISPVILYEILVVAVKFVEVL